MLCATVCMVLRMVAASALRCIMATTMQGQTKNGDVRVLLCDVRSVHNVGALFRTAEGAGVTEVLLAGYTPTPVDRFGRTRADVAKAALGAETLVPWRQVVDAYAELQQLKEEGFEIVVLEQTSRSIPYTAFIPRRPLLLVVGNEITGVPQEICEIAHTCIEIPMSGAKESLNVTTASGIALFYIRDRRA